MSESIVAAAISLVKAKTSYKGKAEWWQVPYGGTKHTLRTSRSWTAAEWKLYQELRDAGLLPEKCLPGKNPDEK